MLRRNGLQELAVVVDDDVGAVRAASPRTSAAVAPVRLHLHVPAEPATRPAILGTSSHGHEGLGST